MLTKKLAVVDPALANTSLIRRFVDAGVDTVVYCDSSIARVEDVRVEMRDFVAGGMHDIDDVGCILELMRGETAERVAFYKDKAIAKSVPLLSYDMSSDTLDALGATLPLDALARVVSISFPTFYQRILVLECVTNEEGSLRGVHALQKEYNNRLAFIIYPSEKLKLFDRIGYFLAASSINAAFGLGIDVEVADHLFANENTGIPLPGIFAMLDQMGLDNFFIELKGLVEYLGEDDLLREVYQSLPPVIQGMISDELTGKSGRGGFYRTYNMRYGNVDQVIDLQSGLYRALKRDKFLQESVLNREEKCDAFFNSVWNRFFAYVKYLVDMYGAGITRHIDEVLRVGYQWQYGTEELATRFCIRDLS